jgi:hypothetical protein
MRSTSKQGVRSRSQLHRSVGSSDPLLRRRTPINEAQISKSSAIENKIRRIFPGKFVKRGVPPEAASAAAVGSPEWRQEYRCV